jgi:hypothetical protein
MEQTAKKISSLLQFFILADQIDLLGPFDSVLDSMKSILVVNYKALLLEHIRVAVLLPQNHTIRKLFAQSCVWGYVFYIHPRLTSNHDYYRAFPFKSWKR